MGQAFLPGHKNSLLIFARTPVAGQVKTRFFPHLTPQQACALHAAMIEDTAELATCFPGRRLVLFSEEIPPLRLPPGTETGRQGSGDLGARLTAALTECFAAGAHKAVVLGSDSPHLPPQRLAEALGALDSADLALGPTEDGGYYLLALRKFAPEIFAGVEWGTARVFQQTRRAAERAGFRVTALEPFYDLDHWEDLQSLVACGATGARRTLALVRGLGVGD